MKIIATYKANEINKYLKKIEQGQQIIERKTVFRKFHKWVTKRDNIELFLENIELL